MVTRLVTDTKFWEITCEGTTHRVCFGKLGSTGQVKLMSYDTPALARAAADQRIADKRAEGYAPEQAAEPAKRAKQPASSALEAQIAQNPDDPSSYLVYADWLQEQGDPRGELIQLQLAGKHAAARKHLEEHASHYWGDLAGHRAHVVDNLRGVERGPRTRWRWGFFETLWIATPTDSDEDLPEDDLPEGVDGSAHVTLARLLTHASTRFLRELTIGAIAGAFSDVVKVLATHPVPTLKKLVLGDFSEDEIQALTESGRVDRADLLDDISKLGRGAPNLEILHIHTGRCDFGPGKLELPHLRELELHTFEVSDKLFSSLGTSQLPALERLYITPDAMLNELSPGVLSKFGKKLARFPKLSDIELPAEDQA